MEAHLADGTVMQFPDETDPEIVKIRAEEYTRGEPPRNPEQLGWELARRKAAPPPGPTGRERLDAQSRMLAPLSFKDVLGGAGMAMGALPEGLSGLGAAGRAFPQLGEQIQRLPARGGGALAGGALGKYLAGTPGMIAGGAGGFLFPEAVPLLRYGGGRGAALLRTMGKWATKAGEEAGPAVEEAAAPAAAKAAAEVTPAADAELTELVKALRGGSLGKYSKAEAEAKAAEILKGSRGGAPPAPPSTVVPFKPPVEPPPALPTPTAGDRVKAITQHLLDHPEDITHVQNEINATSGAHREALRKALRDAIDQMGPLAK